MKQGKEHTSQNTDLRGLHNQNRTCRAAVRNHGLEGCQAEDEPFPQTSSKETGLNLEPRRPVHTRESRKTSCENSRHDPVKKRA